MTAGWDVGIAVGFSTVAGADVGVLLQAANQRINRTITRRDRTVWLWLLFMFFLLTNVSVAPLAQGD